MDISLKQALKKAKRKQIIKIALISIIVVLILLPVFYKTGNYFAAKSTMRLHEALFLHHNISQPNVQIDSQVTSNRSMFGGNIVTNRSKNINGYVVQWSTLTSSYGWLRSEIDFNELIPGFYWSDTGFYEYDKQTKKKVATFYHPSIEEYHDGIQNELADVAQMANHVAEVAISFDQPYPFQEIQEKIPDNLNIVWLYMTSEIRDESMGPAGMPVYGFDPGESPEDAYPHFVDALKTYDDRGYNDAIQEFLVANEDALIEDVEVLGVMLTGQAQNLEALVGEDFIRGASVGAVAEMVPYITPEK
ncbi:sigma factor regulator N-terminal domain-containing protein [Alkalihalophilus lindianensis]|uniref:Sigma factor regulator N-terminal domain-containing protein n=1 Tax=Alkalihalophilus lindianensis TaxID=1630542 RepID=A0ABU3XE37_9BACI|nr:sigma factor regulator N-terminal domain-containing protein [Alkalihalophilus lindianensis]MDV2686154.1 sigma factor regulator N-terminal domain-containing protein [Alkalihalophilus lindianensis]